MKYISKHIKALKSITITDYETIEDLISISRDSYYYSLYKNSKEIEEGLDYISLSYEGMIFSLFDYTLNDNKIVRGMAIHDISIIV